MIRNRSNSSVHFTVLTLALLAVCLPAFSALPPVKKHSTTHHRKTSRSRKAVSTYPDSTVGDIDTYDDPIVRQAAIKGLGRYYGSVVAIDPNDGRILSIVNQKLAFSDGFKPCSTIKPVIAVAALQEGIVSSDTMIRVTRRK